MAMSYEKLLEDIRGSGQTWSDFDLELARKNPEAGRSIYTQKGIATSSPDAAARKAAHDTAEQIRQKYGGYSGGRYGADFIKDDSYAPTAEQYQSPYQSQIADLMEKLQNTEKFTYSPGADAGYQAYAEKYRNLGRQAAQNALGTAAALTGGMPSSYALTASQQAQDGYNAQLSDAIPQLRQAAYDMYLGDLNQQRDNMNLLLNLDQRDYGRHQDSQSAALNRWQLNYGVDRDKLADGRYDKEWSYGVGRDLLEDKRYAEETAHNRQQTTRAASGGGGSGGSSGSGKPRLTASQTMEAIRDGVTSPQVLSAYEYYFGQAYQGEEGTAPAQGMNPSYFNAFAQSLAAQLAAGKREAAQGNMASRWKELSEEQREQITALTQRYQ